MSRLGLLICCHWSPTCCSECLWSTGPATSTHSPAFPSAHKLPSTASREEVHTFQTVAALAMTASPSLMYHYTTNCQPTHHPPFVRSPMEKGTVQLLHRRSPCVRIIEPRSKGTGKCFMVARKARQSKVELFFLRDLNLAFDGVVRMFSNDSRGQPFATLRASSDSSVYLCCLLTPCQNARMGRACRSGRQRRREDCAASPSANSTHELRCGHWKRKCFTTRRYLGLSHLKNVAA